MTGLTARPSALVLIGANFVPLIGVFLWDWSIFEIVLLYWSENVAIGVINALKMIAANPDVSKMGERLSGAMGNLSKQAKSREGSESAKAGGSYADKIEGNAETIGIVHHAMKLFMVPFFCVHYGMFCFVHGMFVISLLGGDGPFGGGASGEFGLGAFKGAFEGPIIFSALVLGGSHLFSFFTNFLGKGEYRKTAVPLLMMQPYGRIVVLHIAILFGAFAVALMGDPVFLLVILIGGKIVLDVKMHLRERRKNSELPARRS